MADIRVENLRKEFNNGEVVAVRDLDITFPSGTTTCLLGPSGCGKTTLMRIIAGLEAPTTGDIYFDNERITHLSTRRRNIGMVFQYPVAYRGSTVRRNMELPLIAEKLAKPERDRRIAEVAELLEMTDALDRDVDTLDNGTRQKVAVARAVARFPKKPAARKRSTRPTTLPTITMRITSGSVKLVVAMSKAADMLRCPVPSAMTERLAGPPRLRRKPVANAPAMSSAVSDSAATPPSIRWGSESTTASERPSATRSPA